MSPDSPARPGRAGALPRPGSLWRSCAATTMALALLAGCAGRPVTPPPAEEVQAVLVVEESVSVPPVRVSRTELPAYELTEGILYEFLLAEIAGQRGDVAMSAQAYADLARRTRDPRVARRATEVAIYARMTNVAIESAQIWHETDPSSTRALQLLAGLLVNASRLDEALPHLEKLLTADGANPADGFLQLSRSVANVQDKAGVLRMMKALAARYPKLAQARYAVAQAALNANEEAAALEEIQESQRLRPDWEPAVMLEAQLLQRRSPEQGIARLARHLEKFPNSRDVRLTYARALLTDKRFPAARGEFQKLLADFPTNTEVIFAVALLSMQLQDYPLAEENLRRLLNLDYRDKNSIRLYLGQVSEEQNKTSEALRWYGEVERGDQFIPAQIRYANLLSKQGKLDDARAHLQQVDASSAAQRVQLVLAETQLLRDAAREKEAFQLVEKALDSQPNQPELLYDYAMLAERIERLDIMESSLRKLISMRPDHAHAYNALGYSLADRNVRLKEARELIEKALELAPDDAYILDSMGWVHYRLGNLKLAREFLERSYALKPEAEVAVHLAEVLWVAGERERSRELLRGVRSKEPDNELLRSTLARLRISL
jgi:tetratricopeptide (TPR) repeat protein